MCWWQFRDFGDYIDVGDGCWRQNVLVPTFRCCVNGSGHFGRQHSEDVTKIEILSSSSHVTNISIFWNNLFDVGDQNSWNRHQHLKLVTKISNLSPTSELLLINHLNSSCRLIWSSANRGWTRFDLVNRGYVIWKALGRSKIGFDFFK